MIEQKSSFVFDSSANLLFNVYLSMLSRIACMSPAKRVGRLVAVAKSPWFQSGIVTSFTIFGRLLRKYSTSWKQERINMLMRFPFINILHHTLLIPKSLITTVNLYIEYIRSLKATDFLFFLLVDCPNFKFFRSRNL
mgnify:CR=1 FL=1